MSADAEFEQILLDFSNLADVVVQARLECEKRFNFNSFLSFEWGS